MHLRSISLRNFKAYETARIDLPKPTEGRNVILIGGKNGFGKTTLFEAIALGLYGRDGIRLILRAGFAADDERRALNFRDFMSRALNRRALKNGQHDCRIELGFENEAGDPITITRAWHFAPDGALRGGSAEDVRILKGLERRPVEAPRSEADVDGWYRDWVAREFLPSNLATFFLFDGEAASAYAERDMGQQVREGIEGLLGLVWLRRLADSLRSYANAKRTEVAKGVTGERILALQQECETLEQDIKDAKTRLDELALLLADADAERDSLTQELKGYGEGTQADLQELQTRRHMEEKRRERSIDKLFALAEADLPFAMAGDVLREKLEQRLDAERRREQWLAALTETQQRAEGVLAAIATDLASVEPPLLPIQNERVRDAVRRGLERLWQPPPTDCAESFRHGHATGRLRETIRERLARSRTANRETISSLLGDMAHAAAELRKINAEIEGKQLAPPQFEAKRTRILELNRHIDALRREEGERRAFIASREPELGQKRADLKRQSEQLDQSQRPARLARRAVEVADMLDEVIREALPLQTREIAAEMTRAIGAMAHKKDQFREVEITEDGEVRLLGEARQNLRELDLSAGEKQVFTQALFAAVATVSQRDFPLVIDTPLGRLDVEHRLNILRFLAQRPGQVILISTDTEVIGPYLDAIRDRIAATFRIEHRADGGFGSSSLVPGYFPGQGL
jgi:DNA sulfur modification protein DndD